jgi:hypothetical protein
MPSRPSKKAKLQPPAKPGASLEGTAGQQASQQRYRERNTKAILGKFQGRKSI